MSWKDNVVETVIETTPEQRNEAMKAIVRLALRREEEAALKINQRFLKKNRKIIR